jgi:hypothetical protein
MTAEPASKPAKTTAANRIIQVVFMATPNRLSGIIHPARETKAYKA